MSAAASVMAIAALAGTAMAYENGKDQKNAARQAQAMARENAAKQEKAATETFKKANPNRPDVSSLLGANAAVAKGGASGTMLTGPTGVDPGSLTLGKSTLLGG